MGLSPLMASLYQYHNLVQQDQALKAQQEQAHAEMVRQAVRDAWQQHYQDETLKLNQQKNAWDINPQNPQNLEAVERTGYLKEQRKELAARPQREADKAAADAEQDVNKNFMQLYMSGQLSPKEAANFAGKKFTPEQVITAGQAAVQAGRLPGTQTITPEFSPVPGAAQGPEQPTPFGQIGLPQGMAPAGTPPVQQGAPVQVPVDPLQLGQQALGLPSPAAMVAQDLQKARAEAQRASAQHAMADLERISARIDKIRDDIDNAKWKRVYTQQEDKADRDFKRWLEVRRNNRFMMGYDLAKDKFAYKKSFDRTHEQRQAYKDAQQAASNTRMAITAYLNPLVAERNKVQAHVKSLEEQQALLTQELNQPLPDPGSASYDTELIKRRELAAKNIALWGTKQDGSEGLIARARGQLNEINQKIGTMQDQLKGLPDLTMKGTSALNNPPASTIPTIRTKEEYDALPKGSTYIDPMGVQRTKRR